MKIVPANIGVDLGGTKTEVILLAPDGSVLFRDRRPTPREEGYEAMLRKVAETIADATRRLTQDSGTNLYGATNKCQTC